jgi:GDP-D-mannose 3', 5'-epimerase
MKTLVIGGGGFIGHNLTKRLKDEGHYVDVIDIKASPDFEASPADNYYQMDASNAEIDFTKYDRVYQLAADMGGAGFVFTGDNDAEILQNSLSVNLNVCRQMLEQQFKGKVFYSSSVCVYPDDVEGKESDAYPANPPSNYGWEKLTSERIYQAYAKNFGLKIRIARFHNCYGPDGTYEGGREKFPAAACRKVLDATDTIEIWGDGKQLRPFIYIDDLLNGIEALMQSDFQGPVNLGPSYGLEIDSLVDMVCEIAGKKLTKVHIPGPTGGQNRYANNDLAKEKLNWFPSVPLEVGIEKTFTWIKNQKYL